MKCYRENRIKQNGIRQESGFSLLELIVAMTVMLILLAAAIGLFAGAFSTRARESSRTDGLTSARAALNAISLELANSGFGLNNNGIVGQDSGLRKIRFRSNIVNNNYATSDPGEDVIYYLDPTTQSIVRYGANDNPQTSVVVNRISDLTFRYFNYVGTNSTGAEVLVPDADTGRVRITVQVILPDVSRQPNNQTVTMTSDVTLRNSTYMLRQY